MILKVLLIGAAIVAVVVVAGVGYFKYKIDNTQDEGMLADTLDKEANKLITAPFNQALAIGAYKDGKLVTKTYGSLQSQGNAPALFQIGSVSKLFTAALLEILHEEGALNMDATLEQVLGPSVPLSPMATKITLRQLASHTSGLPRVPGSLLKKLEQHVGKDKLMQNPYSHFDMATGFEYLKHADDIKPPGKFEYSNIGMGLLGHVMEKITGKDYATLLKEKILLPLGMLNTGIDLPANTNATVVKGFDQNGKETPWWTFKMLAGAGAIYSTADDIGKFIRANLDPTQPLHATLKRMQATQDMGDLRRGWMPAGFMDKFFGNASALWHNGRVGGFSSYLSIDPVSQSGVVILFNRSVSVDMPGMMLTRQARIQSWAKK